MKIKNFFYAALCHESPDSEEDRKGLGCHLGQGLDWIEDRNWKDLRMCSDVKNNVMTYDALPGE